MRPLFQPVPIDTLVWLRIAIGLLGAGDLLGNGIYYHWYLRFFDGYNFAYIGFEWVRPLSEPFMSLFFVIGFFLGLAVAAGYRFRFTAPLFALFFTYLFLIEKAYYLNHGYFFCWLTWLLACTPAWREWSVDVWQDPQAWQPVVPRWALIIFPLSMGIVYFFGGIAKINSDWLLEAQPLQIWLGYKAKKPIIGPLLAQPATAYFMAWGGFLLDISIAFLLLHKRLRWLALAAAIFFHATNHLIFNIGIFPYLSLVLTSLFFEPYWPRDLVAWLAKRLPRVGHWQERWQQRVAAAPAHTFFNRAVIGNLPSPNHSYQQHQPFWGNLSAWQGALLTKAATQQRVTYLFSSLLLLHLLLPLRHHWFDSDVAWSEEGHRYSWRMMLRAKTGGGDFKVDVFHPSKSTTAKDKKELVADSSYLVRPIDRLHQKQYRKLYTHPDMIWQFAQHLAEECRQRGDSCAVYANIKLRLNGRETQTYIDPAVDLANQQWNWLGTHPWVLPETLGH